MLFGIRPLEPHTGYGYIRQGSHWKDQTSARSRWTPSSRSRTAPRRRAIARGGFYWNSGIFVLHAGTFLDELARLEPTILEAARGALAGAEEDLGFVRLERHSFAEAPSISVDHAVMEKTRAAAMLPVDIGWNDIGSWGSLWEIAPRDDRGNYVHGDAVLEDTSGCYVHGEKALIATIGVKDLVIVDTPDTPRRRQVAHAGRFQGRRAAEALEPPRAGAAPAQLPAVGYFETLSPARFQVKVLHVNPGGKLSMQMHHHRSEHWVVVQGTAKVVIGDSERLVRENESVYIVATQWHRLENPGKVRWRSSRCRSAPTSARTTSCAPTTSTTARPRRRSSPQAAAGPLSAWGRWRASRARACSAAPACGGAGGFWSSPATASGATCGSAWGAAGSASAPSRGACGQRHARRAGSWPGKGRPRSALRKDR